MKKSTKGFIAGSLLAGGAIAGLYYAKKKGYLDQAIDYVKDHLNKKAPDESDIFEDEDFAVSESNYFTAPETAPIEPSVSSSADVTAAGADTSDTVPEAETAPISEERSYVALDFDTPVEEPAVEEAPALDSMEEASVEEPSEEE